ncbi:hypothetical protein [Achromobacter veterisilvae]|uniref:hypothetical protein n=1 Tax=Achromobacter veterisilvae TaxID=2069367 RepID=UPI00100E15C0|nr:hypothetical protein [Achromobacter veterisilvae]
MTIQWRRGIRRILIVVSILWLILAGAILATAQAAQGSEDKFADIFADTKAPVQKPPTPWKDVIVKPEFRALTLQQQTTARQQYFDQVVAPYVPNDKLGAARAQFFSAYPLPGETPNFFDQFDEPKKIDPSAVKWDPSTKPPATSILNALFFMFGPIAAIWAAYFTFCWIVAGFRPNSTYSNQHANGVDG